MAITNKEEFIDELKKDCKSADDIVGSGGMVKELTKRLLERMLDAELTTHFGYGKYQIPKEKADEICRFECGFDHGKRNLYCADR